VKKSQHHLPSNKKFGLFFALIFLLLSAYFYFVSAIKLFYVFVSIALILLLISLLRSELLLPFNRLWNAFGRLLGLVVNPIVLGIIFFGLITPLALLLKIFGRDELRLKEIKSQSSWIERVKTNREVDFKQQF